MAEFTYRNIVQRALTYAEVDGNFQRVEELHDAALEARDVAVSDTIIYPDTTAGLAATAEGGYFVVPDTATDELIYYRVESGAAVEKVRIGARLPFAGGTLTQALNHAPAVSLASAATVPIGAAAANAITITGTTTITAFDTIADGAVRVLTFAGALTLTHNATSLILPGGANITTAAGDVAVMLSLGSGNWRCIAYQRAGGTAVVPSALNAFVSADQTITAGGALTLAHGLGTAPRDVSLALVCQTAELGYSVGDVLMGVSPRTVASIVVDATNLNIRFVSAASQPISVVGKTDGQLLEVTPANWKARFFAVK